MMRFDTCHGSSLRHAFLITLLPLSTQGPSSPLARLSDNNPHDRRPKVGQYVVDVPSLDRIASSQLRLSGGGVGGKGRGGVRGGVGGKRGAVGRGEISGAEQAENSTNYVIIDEIGKMELFSSSFKSLVSCLFESSRDGNVRVVATIPVIPARGNPNPFIENIRSRKDAVLFTVTKDNRDTIFDEIVAVL